VCVCVYVCVRVRVCVCVLTRLQKRLHAVSVLVTSTVLGRPQVEDYRRLQSSGVESPREFILDTEVPGFWPEKKKKQDATGGGVAGEGGVLDDNPDDDFSAPSQVTS